MHTARINIPREASLTAAAENRRVSSSADRKREGWFLFRWFCRGPSTGLRDTRCRESRALAIFSRCGQENQQTG